MMNRPVWIVVSFSICLLAPDRLAEAGDRAPKDLVLAEYPAALRRLEQQYACTSGKAVYSSIAKGTGEKERADIQFACDLGLSRTIETYRQDRLQGDSERVRCSSPTSSFQLTRTSPDRPYVIRDVADGTDRADEFGRFYFDGFLSAPYIAFGRPIREIMERPDLGFKLGDVSNVTHEGRRVIRISFEFRLAPGFPTAPAWIEVDPEIGWAVRRYEGLFGPKRDHLRTGAVEYSGMEGGRPVVRHVAHSNSTTDETMDVAEIDFDRHPSLRDFKLSAFGLPDVNEKLGPSGSIPLNYWLFGLGAIALVLSISIRLAHRRRTATSPSEAD